jgi:transposase InsO family protein
MPWKLSDAVNQRVLFVAAVEEQPDEPFSVQCARFGISRKTGYKWIARYNQGGPACLMDGLSKPTRFAHQTSDAVAMKIVDVRKAHPRWGPKKIRAVLSTQDPSTTWPAVSTVGAVLRRYGLIVPRRRRVRWHTPRTDRPTPTGPNETWCVDFKGDFLLGDGTRCYPLTVTDLHSRFVLTILCLGRIDAEAVRAEFERLFLLYGLPTRIRSDNGGPFSTTAPGGLSRLSVWWVKLGIVLERTQPGHPEQNGAHERMHRTLKDEVTHPPKHDRPAQQLDCDRFRQVFNWERPHEALGQTTPASHYTPSLRPMPAELQDPTYAEGWKKLRVSSSGRIQWAGKRIVIHRLLVDELIGLEPVDDHRWTVFFGPVRLGMMDVAADKPRLRPID